MIEARAQVIDVRDDELLLRAETVSTCNACEVRKGCGTSVLSRWLGRRFTQFTAKNTVAAVTGDEVVVGIAENSLLGGSVAVYLVPLLGMMFSALAADSILVSDAENRDLLVIAVAATGFALSLWGCRAWLGGGERKAAMQPVVLRKVHERVPQTDFARPDEHTSAPS